MANSIRRATSHVRSSSWPCTPYPLESSIEDLLLKITSSSSSPSSSVASIRNNLCDIKNLYEGINNLIKCSMNQKVLSLGEHQSVVEEVLEGSLGLLEACSTTNDVLSMMKESIVELQSCLRRKSSEQEKDINAYLISRKKIQKMANKCLKKLCKLNLEKDGKYNIPTLKMLNEAEIISFSALKYVLPYFSEPTNKGKSWSLMTKLMQSKSISYNTQVDSNEIMKIDNAILAYGAKKTNVDVKMSQDLLKQLGVLEVSVQEIEGSLEAISRCL
ncbi:uncharacterized protein LOC110699081 [Chenopodium quinoa]|uniref:uncharacterized protein LOC110699081 n=1 Tax=Chenopodium quinoa TaxID=63459 RepID=UPI000B7950BC|nr:uncharacterized protein LOC110699081 [Chenopodium quinoa]